MIAAGMPAFLALLAASCVDGAFVIGSDDAAIPGAVPGRLVGLLESDLVQALPLFVLMGADQPHGADRHSVSVGPSLGGRRPCRRANPR